MKKLISLLLIFVMLCSVVVVVNAETKTSIEIKWYQVEYDEDEETWSRGSVITEAEPGDYVMARITAPKGAYIGALDFEVKYDAGILTYEAEDGTSGMASITEAVAGVLTSAYITDKGTDNKLKTVAGMIFTVKDEPVKTVDNLFEFSVRGDKSEYYAGGTTKTTFSNADVALTLDELTINGVKEDVEDEKVFTVTAVENGNDVVVTVANKGDKAGFVYVANYVNGVLDNCEVKALADGELTFTGLAGDAKVFVWDANNAPILDAAISL